ncbi:MAG: IS481 family transposase [Actinobacteria bacterium]|nr:IS481 family transposase [Actinomycetota bacterium]
MDVRLRIAVTTPSTNVAAFCREYGISRESFYYWRRRYNEHGLDGLRVRSRAPKMSPHRYDAVVEDEVVALRKELEGEGLDHGPATIRWHLQKRWRNQRRRRVPSVATIGRMLQRRGFVVPEPRKRPKSSFLRFVASRPNELWQADFIEWTLATDDVVRVFSFLDDHSRVALRVKAVAHATTEQAWDAFNDACELWGVPLGQLSDNGLCFSGKLRGIEVFFEKELRAIGVVAKTSRPFHPQTCGKVERFQQTLKKWLRKQPVAADLDELQAQIDAFVATYNYERPHTAIGRVPPAICWAATPPAINLGVALPGPGRRSDTVVLNSGLVEPDHYWRINIGTRWRGRRARVHYDDVHFAVFIDHQLVAAGALDPTRRYQPLRGRKPVVP